MKMTSDGQYIAGSRWGWGVRQGRGVRRSLNSHLSPLSLTFCVLLHLCSQPLPSPSTFPLPFLPLNIPSSFFWQHPGGSDSKESACDAGDLSSKDPWEKGMATHSSILYPFVYTISLISTSSFLIYLCIQQQKFLGLLKEPFHSPSYKIHHLFLNPENLSPPSHVSAQTPYISC